MGSQDSNSRRASRRNVKPPPKYQGITDTNSESDGDQPALSSQGFLAGETGLRRSLKIKTRGREWATSEAPPRRSSMDLSAGEAKKIGAQLEKQVAQALAQHSGQAPSHTAVVSFLKCVASGKVHPAACFTRKPQRQPSGGQAPIKRRSRDSDCEDYVPQGYGKAAWAKKRAKSHWHNPLADAVSLLTIHRGQKWLASVERAAEKASRSAEREAEEAAEAALQQVYDLAGNRGTPELTDGREQSQPAADAVCIARVISNNGATCSTVYEDNTKKQPASIDAVECIDSHQANKRPGGEAGKERGAISTRRNQVSMQAAAESSLPPLWQPAGRESTSEPQEPLLPRPPLWLPSTSAVSQEANNGRQLTSSNQCPSHTQRPMPLPQRLLQDHPQPLIGLLRKADSRLPTVLPGVPLGTGKAANNTNLSIAETSEARPECPEAGREGCAADAYHFAAQTASSRGQHQLGVDSRGSQGLGTEQTRQCHGNGAGPARLQVVEGHALLQNSQANRYRAAACVNLWQMGSSAATGRGRDGQHPVETGSFRGPQNRLGLNQQAKYPSNPLHAQQSQRLAQLVPPSLPAYSNPAEDTRFSPMNGNLPQHSLARGEAPLMVYQPPYPVAPLRQPAMKVMLQGGNSKTPTTSFGLSKDASISAARMEGGSEKQQIPCKTVYNVLAYAGHNTPHVAEHDAFAHVSASFGQPWQIR